MGGSVEACSFECSRVGMNIISHSHHTGIGASSSNVMYSQTMAFSELTSTRDLYVVYT